MIGVIRISRHTGIIGGSKPPGAPLLNRGRFEGVDFHKGEAVADRPRTIGRPWTQASAARSFSAWAAITAMSAILPVCGRSGTPS